MNDPIDILYDKKNGNETTKRKVIITKLPQDFIDALDVTLLNENEISYIVKSHKEYVEYLKLFKQNMFSYDEWLDHTNKSSVKNFVKYRRFKLENLTFV